MATRLPALLDRALLFARRGAPAPDRSHVLDALRQARRLGATGLAADAWTTKDGVAVVDRRGVARRLPRRALRDVPHAAVADRLATVEDLLAEAEGLDVRLTLHDDSVFEAVVDAARRRGRLETLWIDHDDLTTLAGWRDRAPGLRLVNATSIDAMEFGPERRAAELAAARIDAVALRESEWSGGLVTLFHRFDVLAFADDAHFERQAARVIDMGVDGVRSDHPDRLAAVAATFE